MKRSTHTTVATLRQQARTVGTGLLDLIYPPVCLVCGCELDAGALCAVCERDIDPILPPYCDRCGEPIAADRIVCRRCELGPEPAYAWAQAMGQYHGTLLKAIHRLKYDGKAALALPLGRLLARSLQTPSPLFDSRRSTDLPAFDRVVPIPLHPGRLRRRGFNQAERIARVVAEECSWELDAQGLRRVRRTPSQTALTVEERLANVRGAFAVKEPLRYAGKSVLIIDDVLTTTSTVREAARTVREAGASRIGILALARSV